MCILECRICIVFGYENIVVVGFVVETVNGGVVGGGGTKHPADSENCFTLYINIYAFGTLFRFVRGEVLQPTSLQNFEVGVFVDPAIFFSRRGGFVL